MEMETEDEEEENMEIEEDEEEKKPPWYRLPEIVWEKVGDFLSYRPLDMYNLIWTCRGFGSMYSRPNYWRKALVFLGTDGNDNQMLHLRSINGASRRFCTAAMLRCFAWDGLQEVYIESEVCQRCLHPRTVLALKDPVLLCGHLKKLTAKIQGVMYHHEQTIQIVVSMMRSAGEQLKTVQMFAWPITFRGMWPIDGQLWEETLCPGLKTLNLLLTKGAKGAPGETPMRWCPVQFVEMIWNFTTYEVLYLRSHMFNKHLVQHLIENPPANLRCIIIFFKSKDVNDTISYPILEVTGEAFKAAFPQVHIKLVLVVDKGWANVNDQRLHAKFKLEWLLVDTVWIFDTVMHDEEVGGDPCASKHVYRILDLLPAFGGTIETVNVVHPRSLSSDEECRLVEHLTGDWADWPSLCRDVKLRFFVDTRVLDKNDKKRYKIIRVLNDLWEL